VLPATLALLIDYPVNTGITANLSAANASFACVKAPSTQLGASITLQQPGPGQCAGTIMPGSYNLTQTGLPGAVFQGWQCYLIAYDNSTLSLSVSQPTPSVLLNGGDQVTCVAKYAQAAHRRRLRLRSLLNYGV
jgi:hypothetical protein